MRLVWCRVSSFFSVSLSLSPSPLSPGVAPKLSLQYTTCFELKINVHLHTHYGVSPPEGLIGVMMSIDPLSAEVAIKAVTLLGTLLGDQCTHRLYHTIHTT